MTRGGARRAMAAVWVSLAACASPEPIELDLSEAGDAVIAVVLLDDEDAPVRALPLFGVEDGRLSFGERPQVALLDGEVSAAWARISKATMQDRFPGAWAARESFSVLLSPPPAEARAEPSPDRLQWRWTMALPLEVDIRGDALGRVRAGLTFTFEQDAERCRDPERRPLAAYADRLEPLDDQNAGRLRGLVVLDAGRVVVGGKGLFVLERGQPFGGVSLPPEALMHPNAEVMDLALDPRTRGRPEARMYALLYTSEGGPERSALVEVRLDERGLAVVRTATVVQGELRSVDVSPRGEVAASADDGKLVLSEPDGRGLVRHDLELAQGLPPRARALAFTPNPEEPLLATSTSRLHGLPPGGGDWREYLLNRFRATIVIRGLAIDGTEAWIGGSDNSVFHRRSTTDIQQIVLTFPPRMGACADAFDLRPGLGTNRDIVDVTLLERSPIIAYLGCTTLFQIRRSDGCVSVIPMEEGPETSTESIWRVRVFDDQVITVDGAGRVAVSVRP